MICAVFCALHADPFLADPLFARMEGHWRGVGTTQQLESGTTERFSAEVDSVVDGDRLTSTNHVTQPDGSTYVRVYSIVPGPSSGEYRFEPTSGGSSPAMVGSFDGSVLKLDQNLDPDYVIHSETRFPQAGYSVYTETLSHGPNTLSRTEIDYTRDP